MWIKDHSGFVSGVMFIVVGAAFAWGALDYSFGNSIRPGPGYFPFGLGLLLSVVGVGILIQSFTVQIQDGSGLGTVAWKPVTIIAGVIVGAALMLPSLGMLVTLPLVVLVSSMASDEFHLAEALLNATILTVGSWAVFSKALGLAIPLLPAFLG